jgi:nicotinamide mononucleotide transporter
VIAATGWVLRQFTDAALPWWDATASGLAVCAQLLLMRKVFETWSLWIAVDVLSIGIYFAKGVYLTAALYAVFLSLATMGWLAWRREICAAADPVPLLPWKDHRKTLQA